MAFCMLLEMTGSSEDDRLFNAHIISCLSVFGEADFFQYMKRHRAIQKTWRNCIFIFIGVGVLEEIPKLVFLKSTGQLLEMEVKFIQ